jgi:LacI family transcriptional regulator
MSSPRPTLVAVAELAGVSIASASRALNGMTASPRTVERVRRAARELNYIPDATARSLKLGHTLQLAFAVDDVGNPVYVEMMRAIESVVSAGGYRLQVSSTGADTSETADLVRSLSRGYADGLIISPLRIDDALVKELTQAPVPVVVIGKLPEGASLDTVMTDSRAGVGLAVKHLLGSGRRRIGFINGPLDTTPGKSRSEGFDEAMLANGIERIAGDVEIAADFTSEAGTEAARELLGRHLDSGPLDAVVAANDLLAVGTIHEALRCGLRVPEDLAVVGMDDTSLAELFNPGLTSVSLGSAERGREAARLLLERLTEPGRGASRVVVDPFLVVRGSSAPAHGGDL